MDKMDELKKFLHEEIKYSIKSNAKERVNVIPILHNQDKIILQFDGWAIILKSDGTYYWEDTSGG